MLPPARWLLERHGRCVSEDGAEAVRAARPPRSHTSRRGAAQRTNGRWLRHRRGPARPGATAGRFHQRSTEDCAPAWSERWSRVSCFGPWNSSKSRTDAMPESVSIAWSARDTHSASAEDGLGDCERTSRDPAGHVLPVSLGALVLLLVRRVVRFRASVANIEMAGSPIGWVRPMVECCSVPRSKGRSGS